ncbi:hypothetical protein [Rhizobium leguminosarum]|uniref:hypothetical protein n=1 Tax=Rhizobium leguminosarum TaxID=384 RepID=UPI00036D49A5|nr:hypothetical protein [Rhizobium leguminosarum]
MRTNTGAPHLMFGSALMTVSIDEPPSLAAYDASRPNLAVARQFPFVGVCAQSDRDQQRNIGEMAPIPDGRADLLASFSMVDFNPSAPIP